MWVGYVCERDWVLGVGGMHFLVTAPRQKYFFVLKSHLCYFEEATECVGKCMGEWMNRCLGAWMKNSMVTTSTLCQKHCVSMCDILLWLSDEAGDNNCILILNEFLYKNDNILPTER